MTSSICSITTAELRHVFLFSVGRSVSRVVRGASTGTGDESHSHVLLALLVNAKTKYKCAPRRKGKGKIENVIIQGGTWEDTCSGFSKCKVIKPTCHCAVSLMQVEGPGEWQSLCQTGCQLWQVRGGLSEINLPIMHKQWDQHTQMRSTTGCVFSGVVTFPLCRELLDVACVRANDNCCTLLLTPNPKRRGLVTPRCDEEKRERGSYVCPMTPCGARHMSMFSMQLCKAIQSITGRSMVMLDTVLRLQRKKKYFCRRCTGGVTTEVGRSPSRCPREDGQRCIFSCASLRGDACLCPHPKVSSSYISHRATCRWKTNIAFSHVRAV